MTELEGWLMIQLPGRSHWTQRFVKLNGNLLTVSSDSAFKKIKLRIYIRSDVEIVRVGSTEIEIRLPDSTNLSIITSTNEETILWFDALKKSDKNQASMSIDCLDMIKLLGEGQFSNVWLAKNYLNGELVAVKISEDSKTFDNEVNLLKQIHCPFIVKYKFSFSYYSNTYLGIEYVEGEDLFSKMENPIDKHDVLISAAEILCALEYLHNLGFVYRDLKPENIMIGLDGHVKITDFGLCKDLNLKKTSTLCGTPEYAAPEVLERKTYDYKADLWSFGIVLYEMLFQKNPFFSFNQSRMLNNIINGSVKFARGADNSFVELCSLLLKKNPELRPCISDIKKMEFFKAIDWNYLKEMKYEVSYSTINTQNEITNKMDFDGFEYHCSMF